MQRVPYSNYVGSLMYVIVHIKLDIAHVVSMVCRCMSKPSKTHWLGIKWIFRYLKGTMNTGLMFKKIIVVLLL